MKRNHPFLLGMWLFLGLLIAGVAVRHPTHATSPDSAHYLRMAADWRTYEGIFPPGYALLIRLVSVLTTVPGLWASKLVNWLTLGYFGWAWANRVGEKRAVWLLAIWLLPGNLRIAAYTWSETVFMVLLLEAVWHLHCFSMEQSRKNEWRVAGLLAALIWVRYVGVFVAIIPRLHASGCIVKRVLIGLVPLILLNFFLTGYVFGGLRLLPTESWPVLIEMVGIASLNELLLYDYRAGRTLEIVGLALLGQFLMIGAMGWRCWRKKRWRLATFTQKPLARLLFGVGGAYFLTLFLLRTISPFDPLNERLMAPGSICWLVALVLSVQSQHSMISKSPDRAETFMNPS